MTKALPRHSRGPAVKALQELLLRLNPYALPRWGADGSLGAETFHAIATMLHTPEIEDDPVVTVEQQAILAQMEMIARDTDAPEYIDARNEADKSKRKGLRPTASLDICWHQTDCEMGEKPSRYYGVPVHFVVTSGGRIIQLHPIEQLVWAAHALNHGTVSIEIEGHFAGIEGDTSDKSYPDYHKDAGRTPQQLTPIQIKAARECARIIKGQVESTGGKLRAQVTHRQGVDTRRRDPGSAVCKQIILPVAAELGVPFDWALVRGRGSPAPTEWHPESTAGY